MSDVARLLTLPGCFFPSAGSGVTSTPEPIAVPSLLLSKAGESIAGPSSAGFAVIKATAVSNLVVPNLHGCGIAQAIAVPLVVIPGLAASAVTVDLPSSSGSVVAKFMTLASLVVSAVAKSMAVPDLFVPAVAKFLALPGLAVPAVDKSMAEPHLVSTAENSVPVSSLDVSGVGRLAAKLGPLVAIVVKCLATSGLAVCTAARFITGLALWRHSRGLGIPLARDLPLPGEVLVCP